MRVWQQLFRLNFGKMSIDNAPKMLYNCLIVTH